MPVTAQCNLLAPIGPPSTATVTWTATSSTYATGYLLAVTRAGASAGTVTVSGRTTTTAVYSIDNLVTYAFALSSVYRQWTSQPTPNSRNVGCL